MSYFGTVFVHPPLVLVETGTLPGCGPRCGLRLSKSLAEDFLGSTRLAGHSKNGRLR